METKDKTHLNDLAKKWMGFAADPVMQTRKEDWKALHSLRGRRPMTLIETGYIRDFVREDELLCTDAYARNVERFMLDKIIHAEEVGDDIVLEPYFRIGWQMEQPSYGVDVTMESRDLAYVFNHSIKDPADLSKLLQREFSVNRKKSLQQKALLEDVFGGILPVKLGGYSFMDTEEGIFDWVGDYFFGLTWQLHRFIGMDKMLYWYYDHPEAMHAAMQYVVDDRLRMFRTLEEGGCLVPNTDNQMAGPAFYGYCDDLPSGDDAVPLKSLWAWCESQESTNISPEMYAEFVLPYLAQLAGKFGLIYYGCCETVHSNLEMIGQKIHNVRAVSVSKWNDLDRAGELIGGRYVYSRKPAPSPMSGKKPDWPALEKDIADTKRAARNSNLEFLFRDLYDIDGDRGRLNQWVRLMQKEFNM
ncbi:hypothetical protein AGMMS49983_06890 [Clostridia bacterium]|nr:hypothetical protein AGMMS49983_06890 [Clostridia bacterium]